jgi:putative endonuclease
VLKNRIVPEYPPAGGGSTGMFTIYVIYNQKNRKVYIGYTHELEKRLGQHTVGGFKNSFTSRFDGEWKLVYKEQVGTRHEARAREKQLKSYCGREFLKQFIPENPPAGGGRAE